MNTFFEEGLRKKGFNLIAGVDEAGRGALAGPLVAAAVILPVDLRISGLKDSKQLTIAERKNLYQKIIKRAICYSVFYVSPQEIDEIGLQNANIKALSEAVRKLNPFPEYILCDYYSLPFENSISIISGDKTSFSIAAASIVAKVERDNLMEELDQKYPLYDFAKNKGYGTTYHLEALRNFGPSPIHRQSFNRVINPTLF